MCKAKKNALNVSSGIIVSMVAGSQEFAVLTIVTQYNKVKTERNE